MEERRRLNSGNKEAAPDTDPATASDRIRTISDDAFLNMSPDDRMLYLKRLLEEILREKRRSDR